MFLGLLVQNQRPGTWTWMQKWCTGVHTACKAAFTEALTPCCQGPAHGRKPRVTVQWGESPVKLPTTRAERQLSRRLCCFAAWAPPAVSEEGRGARVFIGLGYLEGILKNISVFIFSVTLKGSLLTTSHIFLSKLFFKELKIIVLFLIKWRFYLGVESQNFLYIFFFLSDF